MQIMANVHCTASYSITAAAMIMYQDINILYNFNHIY